MMRWFIASIVIAFVYGFLATDSQAGGHVVVTKTPVVRTFVVNGHSYSLPYGQSIYGARSSAFQSYYFAQNADVLQQQAEFFARMSQQASARAASAAQAQQKAAIVAEAIKAAVEAVMQEYCDDNGDSGAAGLATFRAKCIQCHNGSNADAPNFVPILEGGDPSATCDLILNSLDQIQLGEMPKGGSLTNQEKGAIMQELLDYRRQLNAGGSPNGGTGSGP